MMVGRLKSVKDVKMTAGSSGWPSEPVGEERNNSSDGRHAYRNSTISRLDEQDKTDVPVLAENKINNQATLCMRFPSSYTW